MIEFDHQRMICSFAPTAAGNLHVSKNEKNLCGCDEKKTIPLVESYMKKHIYYGIYVYIYYIIYVTEIYNMR